MSVNGATHDPDDPASVGRAWPGIDEADVAATCMRIARLLVLAKARSVGVLPFAARTGAAGVNLAPLLERLALALSAFDGSPVGVVGAWTSWGDGERATRSPLPAVREVRPGVWGITPPSCPDAVTATAALGALLATPPGNLQRLLVDLGGLAPPGRVPAAASAVDKLVAAVVARRVRKARLADLLAELPPGKGLGTILIG